MRGTLLHRRTQHAHDARRRSSKIWNDLDQLREERRQSKPAPQTRKELLQEKLRAHALACCESTRFTAGMTILTLYALFGDDAKLCLADSTADAAFVYAAVVCIFCFFAEMLLQCLAYPWYFRGFYFWVGLASTLSILTEIPSVMEEVAILVGGSGGQEAEMLKAGKAGRVGTKATKIIRIVRLVRMVRVVKLYKMTGDVDELHQENSSLEPSSVGKKLTERQTIRLISMMLAMILVLPWLYTRTLC